MNRQVRFLAYQLMGAGSLLASGLALADVTQVDLNAINARLQQSSEVLKKFPEDRRKALSSAGLNLLKSAETWKRVKVPTAVKSTKNSQADKVFVDRTAATTPVALDFPKVSDNSTDVSYSSLSGFTQSETSTAWCGNNIVVGYNDTGSTFQQLEVSASKSLTRAGYSHSADSGASFTDMAFLPSDPVPSGTNFYDIGGDPVVACADPNTFYFVTVALNQSSADSATSSEIALSKSTDGGTVFGGPTTAASKTLATHFLDKPWMVVDPTDPKRIYVAYTDFDSSGTSTTCRVASRVGIELVSSSDAGATWSQPTVIAEKCGDSFLQGSQIAVGPDGEVYVAWEAFANSIDSVRKMYIRRSADHTVSFAPAVKVTDVTCVGDCFLLQGGFRSAFDFPSLAVDTSSTYRRGTVYIAWHDGGNISTNDPMVYSGAYRFADVLISRSNNAGKTWSKPIKVNTNQEPLASGRGSDQYQPTIAVDKNGSVGACYYDRRRDEQNFMIDRTCAISRNGGDSWESSLQTEKSFLPITAQDFAINPVYMGDYDTLATDFTKSVPGFMGAYASTRKGTQDVLMSHLFK